MRKKYYQRTRLQLKTEQQRREWVESSLIRIRRREEYCFDPTDILQDNISEGEFFDLAHKINYYYDLYTDVVYDPKTDKFIKKLVR